MELFGFGCADCFRGSRVPYFVFTHGQLDPWFREYYPIKHVAKQLFWLFSEGPLLRHARAVLFTTEEERLLTRNAFWPYRVREHVIGYGTADVGATPTPDRSVLFSHAKSPTDAFCSFSAGYIRKRAAIF